MSRHEGARRRAGHHAVRHIAWRSPRLPVRDEDLVVTTRVIPSSVSTRTAARVIRPVSGLLLAPALPVCLQRRLGEAVFAVARLPRGVTVDNTIIGDRPALVVSPGQPETGRAVLCLHGGGYCYGSPRTHRALAGHLAAAAGVPVYVVDYRLAPEHPYPAALDDAEAAYLDLVGRGLSVDVVGDSAGGGLALSLSMRIRDTGRPTPRSVALLSPWVDLSEESAATGRDTLLHERTVRAWARRYAVGHDLKHPDISPAYGDLHGLPRMLVHVSPEEIIAADIHRLVECVRSAGGDVEVATIDSWHDVHVHAGLFAPATAAVAEVGRYLTAGHISSDETMNKEGIERSL